MIEMLASGGATVRCRKCVFVPSCFAPRLEYDLGKQLPISTTRQETFDFRHEKKIKMR
jgi:hypothetical protein